MPSGTGARAGVGAVGHARQVLLPPRRRAGPPGAPHGSTAVVPPRPRADRVATGIAWAAAGLVGGVAVLGVAPRLVGLSMTTPWAQGVQLRAASAAGCLALAVVLLVVAGLVRLARRRAAHRRTPPQALVLALVLVLVAGGHAGALALRTEVPAGTADGTSAARPGDLVVTALNAGPDGATPDDVAALALRRGSQVLALSETRPEAARAVADELAAAGRPVQLLSAEPVGPALPGSWAEGLLLPLVRADTHLLVAEELGPYVAEPAPPLLGGAVVARPADGDGPPLASVHTLPAVPVLFDMGRWRAETAMAVALCARLPGGVVAGDLNATRDHAVLRGSACDPAAAVTGGSWPTDLPPALASPIDHVLADPGTWSVVGRALDDVGSDHRAVTAVLRPRTAP